MTFDGKRIEELSDEEIEAAKAYCIKTQADAEAIWRLNAAGFCELRQGQERRRKAALN